MNDQSAPSQPPPPAQQAQAEALARLIADPHATDIYIAYLNQRMESVRRQKTIQNLTLWVPAIVGILGLIGVFVSDYVIDKAAERARQAVQDEHIQNAVAQLDKEILLQRLAVNALSLDLKTRIDTSIANETLDQLVKISEFSDLRQRSDFRYVLERVTVGFIAFDLPDHVMRLADLYPDEIAASANAVGPMAAYLAESGLGNAMPFERWPETDVARIAYFLDAGHQQDVGYQVMAFEMLVEYARDGASDVTRALLDQLGDLSPADQAYVIEDFISLAEPGLRSDRVDADTHRLAERARAFIADHRDALNAFLESVPLQEELLLIAEGFRNDSPDRSRAIREIVSNGF